MTMTAAFYSDLESETQRSLSLARFGVVQRHEQTFMPLLREKSLGYLVTDLNDVLSPVAVLAGTARKGQQHGKMLFCP